MMLLTVDGQKGRCDWGRIDWEAQSCRASSQVCGGVLDILTFAALAGGLGESRDLKAD
jgi:hypothetical protein